MKLFLFLCLISVFGLSSDGMIVENNDEEQNFQANLLHQLAERSLPQGKLERVIKLRVAKEKSIDLKNAHGETPFITALRVGNAHAAQLFLHGGCDITAEDREGRRALHLAAQAGDVDTVRTLIERNVAIDEYDRERNTPLHVVSILAKSFNQPYGTIELEAYQAVCADLILRRAGAILSNKLDLLAKLDSYKRTPLDRACGSNWGVVAVFVKHGAVVPPACAHYIAEDFVRCMRLLHGETARNYKEKNCFE